MLRSTLLPLLLALGTVLAGPAYAVPPADATSVAAAPGRAVPGRYIVTLDATADARGLVRAMQVSPRFVYTEALNGFAADLRPGQLRALQRNPAVTAIEEDQEVTADRLPTEGDTAVTATQYVDARGGLWGLDRIDQPSLPLSGTYVHRQSGASVTAYVIDTGIATAHRDFGGRARNVYDAFGGNGRDCNGHGTHVAGTLGGSTHGVAKRVQLRGLRVLSCDGSGTTSGIIAAIDWLRANHVKPAVANMSLGGGYSRAVNRAVTSLANAGVAVAVAAGNEGVPACFASPASASNVTTVAASDRTDTRASFSNSGSCVDVYAPGVAVRSAWIGGGATTKSGTSMASPHVAGVMAQYKGAYGDATSSTVNSWVVARATTGSVRRNPSGTPNRLLFTAGL